MIYLDHNATTPVLEEVQESMLIHFDSQWGNPSSSHRFGQSARKVVECAREFVSELVGAHPEQVIFTSGATEANNAALHTVFSHTKKSRGILTTKVEHSSVLAYCSYLEKTHQIPVEYLAVSHSGTIDLGSIASKQTADRYSSLVSLIWANNETGVINPVQQLIDHCKLGASHVHLDAVQAVGKIPVKFHDLEIDSMSLSGHKFGAPKGIGALIVRDPSKFLPFIYGGKQEQGLRGGTESVPLIVALGKAAEIALARSEGDSSRIREIRDGFETTLKRLVPSVQFHGAGAERIPNTSNFHIPGMDGDAVVTFLDQRGICASSGSACLESAISPSHVILTMTGSHDKASESLRVSLGSSNTAEELEITAKAIAEFVSLCA